MKKVLCVGNHFYPRGGSDRYMVNLFELLSKRGHEAIPFSSKHDLNYASQWDAYFPDYIDTNNSGLKTGYRLIYSKRARQNISRLLDSVSVDVAHLNIYSQFTSSILQPIKERGIPIVQTLHDFKPVCPTYSLYRNGQLCEDCAAGSTWNAIRYQCNKGSLKRSAGTVLEEHFSRFMGSISKVDHFITVCDFQREKLQQYKGLGDSQVMTIPNFIDLDHYAPRNKEQDYLFYFGRLEDIKGLWTLIEAMAPLSQLKLVIAGEGRLEAALQKHVTQKDLRHITFLPYQQQPELLKLIAESTCTILPSECYELCPMSILESMAMGKMVIASKIGGIPELIQDYENGMLFEPGNAEDLRGKIEEAFANKVKTREMGLNGRERVETHYTSDKHHERLMEVYSKVQ